ncbi:hypothetical protein [Prauserella cavernicola]|uniref:Secreted protein n=1 Tax=Prauserella cavernicola TaxID=2800127 RepID=A0A934V3G8_9PSEU|nr:hypothetical protein [Prauserella cavernicola]MBK1787271.1 hypothetical protein [Prauserella cavernicola]
MRTTGSRGLTRGIGRSAVVAAAVLGTVGAGFTATAAEQASPTSWTASHGGGSASGTASHVNPEGIGADLVVDGTLRVNDSDCYFAKIIVVHDFAPIHYDTAEQCGPGNIPVDKTIRVTLRSWTATIEICRTDRTDCGDPTSINVFG